METKSPENIRVKKLEISYNNKKDGFISHPFYLSTFYECCFCNALFFRSIFDVHSPE